MKPSKWEVIVVCLLWLGLLLWLLPDIGPLRPERIDGMRSAWAECDASVDEKRVVAKKVAAFLHAFHEHLAKDGQTKAPTIKTAQQAARLRYTLAKTELAGTGFCGDGCKFAPVARLSSDYLKAHLGVAADYKLDEPFPSNKERTGRRQWEIVVENLELALVESCP